MEHKHKKEVKEIVFDKKFNNQLKQFHNILKAKWWEYTIIPQETSISIKIEMREDNVYRYTFNRPTLDYTDIITDTKIEMIEVADKLWFTIKELADFRNNQPPTLC